MIYIILYIVAAIIVCIVLTLKDYNDFKDIFGRTRLFNFIEPSDFLKDNLIKSAIWPLYLCYIILRIIINFLCSKL